MKIKNIIRKIIRIEPQEAKDLEAVELWAVRWRCRYGKYSDDTEPTAEFFTNESDAKEFYNVLKKALKVLKYTENIGLSINKINKG